MTVETDPQAQTLGDDQHPSPVEKDGDTREAAAANGDVEDGGEEVVEEDAGEESPQGQPALPGEGHTSQAVTSSTSPSTVQRPKEDKSDWERSTIVIVTTLHAQLEEQPHPDGRRVSVSVHNGSGRPVNSWYRAGQLTTNSELDGLQTMAIAPTVQRFRAIELPRRQRETHQRQQKPRQPQRTERPTPPHPSNETTAAKPVEKSTEPVQEAAGDPVPPTTNQIAVAPPSPTTTNPKAKKGSGDESVEQQALF